jgi:hypothetical protein
MAYFRYLGHNPSLLQYILILNCVSPNHHFESYQGLESVVALPFSSVTAREFSESLLFSYTLTCGGKTLQYYSENIPNYQNIYAVRRFISYFDQLHRVICIHVLFSLLKIQTIFSLTLTFYGEIRGILQYSK